MQVATVTDKTLMAYYRAQVAEDEALYAAVQASYDPNWVTDDPLVRRLGARGAAERVVPVVPSVVPGPAVEARRFNPDGHFNDAKLHLDPDCPTSCVVRVDDTRSLPFFVEVHLDLAALLAQVTPSTAGSARASLTLPETAVRTRLERVEADGAVRYNAGGRVSDRRLTLCFDETRRPSEARLVLRDAEFPQFSLSTEFSLDFVPPRLSPQ